MRLEELVFCLVFFIVPLMGMIGLVVEQVIKGDSSVDHKSQVMRSLRKEKRSTCPVFASPKVMEYQMLEDQGHLPLQFTKFKGRAETRAGP